MRDRFVSTPFGRIHLHQGGSGSPLILLHSNGGSAFDFEAVTARLCQHFEVFAWDMPGQGDSDPLHRHMSVEQYGDALLATMDALEIARASVVGVSIGAAICVALGGRHGQRFQRLFVVECPFRSEAEWQQQWPRIEANFAQPIQTIAAVAPRLRSVPDGFLERWNIDRSKAGAKAMISVMWALRAYAATDDPASLPEGTVIVYGRKGPTIAGMEAFTAPMSRPVIEILEDCGHFPMFDAPDEFCALIERHLGTSAGAV